ncbi:hypothetical protein H839_09263 [Parageobacillus genomosp. 1]|uniref:Uncharacterized protein n=1 Tax=Parageobacillus genomosp. 1 TaxID=1295642 RepID=A0ABC9VEE1_9BACL|nr:hypothetical protein [Parageobacillus genomosp. 1]EZP76773.1 hypothetical protein H839_09263 [Parageobacillus genomosp. 1]
MWGDDIDSISNLKSVFAPAWVKDANGSPVPTHYIVDGNDLIQVVDFDENQLFQSLLIQIG